MDAPHRSGSNGDLEDQIRRMILRGGSTPDDEDTTPRVRLPPAQQAQGMQPFPTHQWPNGTPSSPASPHGYGLPPPGMVPPAFAPQGQQSYPVPPHMRRPQFQQSPSPYDQRSQYAAPFPHPPPPMQGYPPSPPPRGHGPERQQQMPLDPDAFNRGGPAPSHGRPSPQPRILYDPNGRTMMPQYARNEQRERQAQYLEQIASSEVPSVEMSQAERNEKDSFRQALQKLCHDVCEENPRLPKVSLECFGSFRSGFASAGSDMDLVIVVHDQAATTAAFSLMEEDLPRELERKLLRAGHGARLLTRTRVPIIKVCERPSESLLDKLRAEREKWDFLPNEKKYPHLHQGNEDDDGDEDAHAAEGTSVQKVVDVKKDVSADSVAAAVETPSTAVQSSSSNGTADANAVTPATETKTEAIVVSGPNGQTSTTLKQQQTKTWTRERKAGPLDFPKDGIGIQCDINFFNPLGLHNTQMLRCYSLCDPRVRPIVLFVKSWAKLRGINSSYSGTLSSYGYVLMVLHYLMNVADPPVIPNLQDSWRPHPRCTPPGITATEVDGWIVDFWRNEEEIIAAVQNGQMSTNRELLGSLLLGFFQYYASQGQGPKFHWMNEVLSLRSPVGILSKAGKGWVKATTEEGEGKKIQHRYLFCIEDPFELSHNVARTVTHNGIVAIRDEFRRANRILQAVGWGKQPQDGQLFDKLVEADSNIVASTAQLKLGTGTAGHEQVNGTTPRPEQDRQRRPSRQPQQKAPNGILNQGRPPAQRPKAKALDIADKEAFPSLGAAPAKKSRQNKASISTMHGEGSITGSKAQAYLEEFRRKKAEQEAEHTAMGAAEAVLNDDD